MYRVSIGSVHFASWVRSALTENSIFNSQVCFGKLVWHAYLQSTLASLPFLSVTYTGGSRL